MKKVVFKSKMFYYVLIAILIVLLVLNTIQLLDKNWKMLVPISVQTLLLFLIFSKNYYSKLAIKIWLIILLITGIIQIFIGVFYILAEEAKLLNLFVRLSFIVLEIFLLVKLKSIEVIDDSVS